VKGLSFNEGRRCHADVDRREGGRAKSERCVGSIGNDGHALSHSVVDTTVVLAAADSHVGSWRRRIAIALIALGGAVMRRTSWRVGGARHVRHTQERARHHNRREPGEDNH
jgi:hypothetical protein